MKLCPILIAALALCVAASPTVAADIEAGKARAEPCVNCHGANGVSEIPNTPSLAAQPDGFIQWQLVYFRSGKRKNEVMEPLASELSDEDVRNLAAYFASLPPPAPPSEPDPSPELTEAGQRLSREHRCTSCHKEDFSGQQATPRLAAQREDALLKSLQDYKSGERTGAGLAAMPEAVRPLSAEDLEALAHYLARLP